MTPWTSKSTGLALMLALAGIGGCAHVEPSRGTPPAPTPRPIAAITATGGVAPGPTDAGAPDAHAAPPAPAASAPPLITVRPTAPPDERCPLRAERPDLVVARVGRTRITVCDVLLEWHRRARGGFRVDDPRALVASLLRDVMLATRSPMPLPQDLEIARTLADALLRREASSELAEVDTTDQALARYAEAHRGQFVRDPRLHVRAVALPSREEAVAAIAAIRAGAPLTSLAAASVDRTLRRDWGDLGMLTAESSAAVPAAVIAAARSIPRDGAVFDAPVEVPVPRARSRRARRQGGAARAWWVVERIAESGEENLPEPQVRRRVAQRLLRERYRDALRAAELRLRAQVADRARGAIAREGVAAVRVEAPR